MHRGVMEVTLGLSIAWLRHSLVPGAERRKRQFASCMTTQWLLDSQRALRLCQPAADDAAGERPDLDEI